MFACIIKIVHVIMIVVLNKIYKVNDSFNKILYIGAKYINTRNLMFTKKKHIYAWILQFLN